MQETNIGYLVPEMCTAPYTTNHIHVHPEPMSLMHFSLTINDNEFICGYDG